MESKAITIRRSRPLTVLLSEILSQPIPQELQLLLTGRRLDGRKKMGRPRKGTLYALPESATFGECLILALVAKAISGDIQAAKLVLLYIEGKPQRTLARLPTDADSTDTGVIDRLMQLFKTPPIEPDVLTVSTPTNE